MNLLGIGSIIQGVGKIADDLFTSDEERLKIALKEKEIEAELVKGQLEINRAEAQHKSIFVAGWRPFIGWVGGLALAYQFIIYPLMVWLWTLSQANNWISAEIKPPPVFQAGPLFAIVTGMLGIGGMRSFDKLKKTQTDRIR
ncbi:MAG: holin family protein [Deltaproteobacteria bacterium]|nr:holin family protein [Deltaproteobacteria bacterium]MBW2130154.1 holin family protein [Deltaproteobacteria bacterium]MBW2303607.1 holin family protein [Deltaproteobacteria bacterium]